MSAPAALTAAGAKAPSGLQHARLELLEPPPDGSTSGESRRQIGSIAFQFNPKELTLAKAATWSRDTAANAARCAPPEFTGSRPGTLSVEMFLDATHAMDDSVVTAVDRLIACCVPTDKSLRAKKPSPPWVVFRWGSTTGFRSFVSSVNARYTLFTPAGLPVRAVCAVTLEEIPSEPGGQNPTSGALTATDVHVVVSGDSLASVAYHAYGSPTHWRAIAEANGIDDPMRLRPGTRLLVPALDDLEPARGGE